MKALIVLGLLAIGSTAKAEKIPTPVLNKIYSKHLAAPYSCNGSYSKSALFLSAYSKEINAPELLFNGACGSAPYVAAITAGDDFAVIADLGDVPLEKLTSSKALNWRGVSDQDNAFKTDQPAVLNHTYAVLISKQNIRALYAFKIVSLVKDGPMTILFTVKSYSIQETRAESEGFSWDSEND